MNYLLRVINQNLAQCEQSVTNDLGDDGYSFVARVENGVVGSEQTLFDSAIEEYFKGVPCSESEKNNIKVIVFGKNNTYVVKSHEVAYIVNAETGKTIERIYGQYVKY